MADLETLAATLLEHETSKEVQDVKLAILKRIAAESDIKPSRIPAPLNITEIGGYFNLMKKMKDEAKADEQKVFAEMLQQTLTSILGLPMNTPM